MLNKIKAYMMPVSMGIGAIFYQFFGFLSFITPYLIFIMLFLTYTNLKISDLHLSKSHFVLLSVQVFGSIAVFLLLKPFNVTLAQGAMICFLAPTGTAAPVMTGILKGNVASITSYSLLINMIVAVLAPIIFSFVGKYQNLPFFESFFAIGQRVFLLLMLPFVVTILLRRFKPALTEKIGHYSGLSFYVWSFALAVVTGRTVQFMLEQGKSDYWIEISIAVIALFISVIQFFVGRKIGIYFRDTVACGQSLGQKNTILAIWMAQMYLNPIASIGPGSYVLWQNIINSYQVWLQSRKNELIN